MEPNLLPWNDVGVFFRRLFGGRVSKVLVNVGRPCPHRASGGGCVFCDEESILPPYLRAPLPVAEQVRRGMEVRNRRGTTVGGIAYFQRGTNTAAPVEMLRREFEEALAVNGVVALAVGTRPDCLPASVIELFAELASRRPLFVDLGLQSTHSATLERIRRGHDAAAFESAVLKLATLPGALPVAHMILGLPGEDVSMMRASFRWLARLPLHGVKIHHLQVVRGTPLADDYQTGRILTIAQEDYVPLLADVLEELPADFVIHRLAGDQPTTVLLAPRWTWSKTRLRQALVDEFKRRGTSQGACVDVRRTRVPERAGGMNQK